MPLYGYKCEICGHAWDEFRPLGDHAAICPDCGGIGRHVFAPTRFKFTGGATLGRPTSGESDGTVSTRTYRPGERVGDPLLDDGFRPGVME